MEENKKQQGEQVQAEIKSHTAEADNNEGDKKAETSLKKFKTIEALLTAYENLEAEFTRKSQKLAELENLLGNSTSTAENAQITAPAEPQFNLQDISDDSFIEKYILTDKAITSRVINEYLKELCKSKAPKTIAYDSGVTAFRRFIKLPKTKWKNICLQTRSLKRILPRTESRVLICSVIKVSEK